MNLEEISVDENSLYRVAQNNYGQLTRQIVVPDSYIHQALFPAHSLPTACHRGVQVTLARCQQFSYWPGIK